VIPQTKKKDEPNFRIKIGGFQASFTRAGPGLLFARVKPQMTQKPHDTLSLNPRMISSHLKKKLCMRT
jgi:hypothetical protein